MKIHKSLNKLNSKLSIFTSNNPVICGLNLNLLINSYLNVKPNLELSLTLAQKDKVDYIYNTAALEGNAMTYVEVATLLDGTTTGLKSHQNMRFSEDEQQILNQNKPVKFLLNLVKEKSFKLDKKTITNLHSLVAYEEALTWGKFRDSSVNIGGTEYKPPLANDLDDILRPC